MSVRSRSAKTGPGRDVQLWPVLLLLLIVVLVPTVCLLWFMNQVIQNERLATRQQLAEAYRRDLANVRERLDRYWEKKAEALEKTAEENASGAAVFAACVRSGLADGVVCYGDRGQLTYPAAAVVVPAGAGDQDGAAWAEARRLEYTDNDPAAAADAYGTIAGQHAGTGQAARALQAQARCLVRAGERDAAIELITEELVKDEYRNAVDRQGRLIVANAELMALQLMGDPAGAGFRTTAERLAQRLTDYDHEVLSSTQRRFLMKELKGMVGRRVEFPTLAAEDLAARFAEVHPSPREDPVLRLSQLPDVWQLGRPGGRVVALFGTRTVRAQMHRVAAARSLPAGVSVALLSPEEETRSESSFHSIPAGGRLPGWRLALSLGDRGLLETAADQRIAFYLWTGILVIGAISILAVLIAHTFRRQVRLTRLKNDLVATVSHELKTPLSSIRLLVDTLLDSEQINEQTAREYLELVAKENTRLTHLIDNFLTFSRMDRNKHALELAEVAAADVVRGAVEAAGERFDSPRCRFEVEIAPDLPPIVADADALVTAVLNLLDNAYKYSEDGRHIELRAYAAGPDVCFAVTDHGLGLTKAASKRVFRRFYQVDRSLSRSSGGCGLGLSIVQFIVAAHGGTVRVASRLGHGSTFTLTVPAAPNEHGQLPR